MYEDIGNKIKMLAKILAIGFGIIFFLMGIGYMQYDVGTGFVTIILGPLLSWAGSFVLYGFGELIVTSKNIEKNLTKYKEEENNNEVK